MSEPIDGTPVFNRATRVPLEAVVRLHFEGEVSYQNGFSANVSATGLFVKHPEPHAIGTHLAFEFLVGARRRPVQGVGQVVWLRAKYEGPGKPAGMGILYEDLDPASREHLTQALFEYLEESIGGELVTVPAATPPEGPSPSASLAPATGQPFRLDLDIGRDVSESTSPPVLESGLTPPTDAEAKIESRLFVPPEEPLPGAGDTAPALRENHDLWLAQREPLLPAPSSAPLSDEAEALPPRTSRSLLWPAVAGLGVVVLAAGGYWYGSQWPATAVPPAARTSVHPAPGEVPPAPRATGVPVAEPVASPAPTTAPEVTPPAASLAAPAASPPASTESIVRFSSLREIRVRPEAGATTVELLLDGSIAAGDYGVAPMAGENPRLLVKLRRVGGPYARGKVEATSPELRGVRVGFHEAAGGNDLHIVLDLGASDPRRAEVTPSGSRLLVRLPGRG